MNTEEVALKLVALCREQKWLEAINSLIQSAKAKARGFRNSSYLITMVYLIARKLDFKLPTFAQTTHTK